MRILLVYLKRIPGINNTNHIIYYYIVYNNNFNKY